MLFFRKQSKSWKNDFLNISPTKQMLNQLQLFIQAFFFIYISISWIQSQTDKVVHFVLLHHGVVSAQGYLF